MVGKEKMVDVTELQHGDDCRGRQPTGQHAISRERRYSSHEQHQENLIRAGYKG